MRYVAFGHGQDVTTTQRDGLTGASDARSDFEPEADPVDVAGRVARLVAAAQPPG